MSDAYWLIQIGRYEQAERAVRDALAATPGDGRLLTLLASVLRLRRDYPAALATADQAVAAAPDLADAHAERAENLIVLLRATDAVAAAEEATRLAPLGAGTHRVLARALAAARMHDRARAAAAHGLALDPRSVEGLLTVADVERQAGNRDAALAATHAALAIDPANPSGRWLIAVLDAERLRVRRSMRGLRDVARDNPASPDLIAMTWPIRGVLGGLRRGLTVGAGLVCVLVVAGHWWSHAGGFARIVAAVVAAVLAGFAARVLLPAGRLPWRCLRLLPALMRRANVAGLVTVALAVAMLAAYAVTGWGTAAVLALALAPVLWAYSMIEALGLGLDDPGARPALLALGDEFRDWWVTTKRDLRDAWKD